MTKKGFKISKFQGFKDKGGECSHVECPLETLKL